MESALVAKWWQKVGMDLIQELFNTILKEILVPIFSRYDMRMVQMKAITRPKSATQKLMHSWYQHLKIGSWNLIIVSITV